MARSSDIAARRARASAAATVTAAAELFRGGEPLTEAVRGELAALLEDVASVRARDSIDAHTWGAIMRLARAVTDPHRPPDGGGKPLPPGFASPGRPGRAESERTRTTGSGLGG